MTKTELEAYGISAQLEDEAAAEGFLAARVVSQQKDLYRVICAEGEVSARVSGKLRFAAERPEDYPTVGDFAMIFYQAGESRIERLLPRRSVFQRLDPSSSGYAAQTAAANFDYVLINQSKPARAEKGRKERKMKNGRYR